MRSAAHKIFHGRHRYIFLRQITCKLPAFLAVWGSQLKAKPSFFDFKSQAAVLIIVNRPTLRGILPCVLSQSVFECGVVGTDLDHAIHLVEIDGRCFLFLRKTCFHKTSIFSQIFSGLSPVKMTAFSDGERQVMTSSIRTLSFEILRFFQLYTGLVGIFSCRHFFPMSTEQMPQAVSLNHRLVATDFPSQHLVFLLYPCGIEPATDGLILGQLGCQGDHLSLKFRDQLVRRIQCLLQLGFLFLLCDVLFLPTLQASRIRSVPT